MAAKTGIQGTFICFYWHLIRNKSVSLHLNWVHTRYLYICAKNEGKQQTMPRHYGKNMEMVWS